jgi:hypothetical protein
MVMKISLLITSCCFFIVVNILTLTAQQRPISFDPDLKKSFLTPPDSIKPSVYWYWMMGNISADGIERDLQAMSQVGIGHVISFLLGEGHLCNGCDVKGELLGKTMTHDGKIVEFDKF